MLLVGEGATERANVADRRLLLGSLRDAGFIEYEDGTMRPTAAIVLVTGSGKGEGDDPTVGSRILADFAEALSADGTVVVAGGPEADRDGGVIEVLENSRTAGAVRTQAAIGDPAGRVGVVRAIVEGKGGEAPTGEAPVEEAPAEEAPAAE